MAVPIGRSSRDPGSSRRAIQQRIGPLHPHPTPGADGKPTDEYPFTLTTGRILYHYHTGSMTRRCEGIEALAPVCNAEIHPKDAGELGIGEGDEVLISSRRGEIVVRAELTTRVPRKTVFVPFHYAEAAVNKLTLPALDPICKIPEFKVCAVQMKKAA
jgi:predicted molibdopterin-dependent oxidoreductase YjgC